MTDRKPVLTNHTNSISSIQKPDSKYKIKKNQWVYEEDEEYDPELTNQSSPVRSLKNKNNNLSPFKGLGKMPGKTSVHDLELQEGT